MKSSQIFESAGGVRRLLWVAGLAIFLVQLGIGLSSLAETFQIVFRDAPYDLVPKTLRDDVEFVKQRTTPGAAILYVMRTREYWQSRLWHRMLYPTPVLFLDGEPAAPVLRALKARHGVRFALSVGDPPLDVGFQWHVVLPATPGYPETWFGELNP